MNLNKKESHLCTKLITAILRYVKTETQSDPTSHTTPSTQTQVEFAQVLKKELEDLGLSDVTYNTENGFVDSYTT